MEHNFNPINAARGVAEAHLIDRAFEKTVPVSWRVGDFLEKIFPIDRSFRMLGIPVGYTSVVPSTRTPLQ